MNQQPRTQPKMYLNFKSRKARQQFKVRSQQWWQLSCCEHNIHCEALEERQRRGKRWQLQRLELPEWLIMSHSKLTCSQQGKTLQEWIRRAKCSLWGLILSNYWILEDTESQWLWLCLEFIQGLIDRRRQNLGFMNFIQLKRVL
jgi:hypothetical protein